MEMKLPTFPVEQCLSIPAEESCQLVFLPPVCLIVIFCNVTKLACMVLAARDDREDVFLNIGDAVASFLTCPDPTTESAGLLSNDAVRKSTQGWCKTGVIYSRIPPTEIPLLRPNVSHNASAGHKQSAKPAGSLHFNHNPSKLPPLPGPNKRHRDLRFLNMAPRHRRAPCRDNNNRNKRRPHIPTVLALVLLSNTPQLLLSCAYFTYNMCLTCMLAAVEYDSYALDRKYLRVSWPRGSQRSTYYVTLPYRYSLPLLVVSAVLHWLVSQSLFYVEIISLSMEGSKYAIITCGFSPVAILFALIIGVCLIFIAAGLGVRRFHSHMPVIGHCSAAISAACHPGLDGNHAMKPIHWGEVLSTLDTSGSADDGSDSGIVVHPGRGGDRNRNPSDWLLEEEIEMDSLERRVYHCSFTPGEVVEPSLARLYI
ncbi:hypothetical protein PHISCL_08473 [Aspergillus sclerotialis]|uniref:Uncharacterized protein n=1 Tax=Aspergillus sclerotialis TaxID=2070753 RepID=A0A3A2Z8G2_9EURO|nr:hypothetical protein PHISCL_08473 [Aspergillus sclerotialis]